MPIKRDGANGNALLHENALGGLGSDKLEPKVPSNIYLLVSPLRYVSSLKSLRDHVLTNNAMYCIDHSHIGIAFSIPQNVAFYSFAIFALGQMFVAICLAKSAAMVADSSAMVIDSLTYLFNSYAERIKNMSLQENDDETLSEAERELRRLGRTRQRLWLEILPPLCSVLTLIALTICIIIDALNTLLEPNDDVFLDDGTISTENDPNIGIMFFFSALNLGLDILNVSCFARAKHAFGFAVIDKDRHRYMLAYDGSLHNEFADSLRGVLSEVDLSGLNNDEESFTANYRSVAEEKINHSHPKTDEVNERPPEVNLNMCSAYTVSVNQIVPALCLFRFQAVLFLKLVLCPCTANVACFC